jgi:hypothetical protein
VVLATGFPGARARPGITDQGAAKMKSKVAWAALCAILVSGCSSAPRWETAVFPQQVHYDGANAPSQAVADQKK